MASDRRTGGRLEDRPDQPRAALRAGAQDGRLLQNVSVVMCSRPTRVAKSSSLRHQRHRPQRAIRRSPNAHRSWRAPASWPVHPCGNELEHRCCRKRQQQAPGPEASAPLSWTNGSSRPVLGLDSGDFCSERRQASRPSSPTLPSSSPRKAAPIHLRDDERVVAREPAVRGEDEEVEPDSERLAVLGDRLPVEFDDVAEPLGVVAAPEAEPLGADLCSYALAARASISSYPCASASP